MEIHLLIRSTKAGALAPATPERGPGLDRHYPALNKGRSVSSGDTISLGNGASHS